MSGDALLSAATEGSTHYYHTDGLGSVRHLSDASGALTDSYTYDAYGLLTASRGATVNPYRYRGEQYDADLNAYYLRARYYQPGTGRFLTTDLMEGFPTEPLSLHRYLYGNDAPVNFVDPSGKTSLTEFMVTSGIILGLNASLYELSWSETGQKIYGGIGKNFAPDAYIVGLSGTGSGQLFKGIAKLLNSALPGIVPPGVFGGRGVEILLSIASAQVALFDVKPMAGIEYTDDSSPYADVSVSFYRGVVWNLWNAKDYEGPFTSVSLSGFEDSRLNNWGVFRDPTRWNGPWGGMKLNSRQLLEYPHYSEKTGVQIGLMYYRTLKGKSVDSDWQELSIVPLILLVEGFYSMKTRTLTPAKAVFGATLWIQLAVAKGHWNRQADYDVHVRQIRTREEFETLTKREYKSGPGHLLFSIIQSLLGS